MKNEKCKNEEGVRSFLHFAFCIFNFARLLRRALAVLALLVTLTVAPDQVDAHSILVESAPAHGAKLSTSPPTAQLRFNSRIEPALTRVSLAEGRHQPTALEISKESVVDRIIVPLPPLAPGVYTLIYRVLALDGHVTKGLVQFTVLPTDVAP